MKTIANNILALADNIPQLIRYWSICNRCLSPFERRRVIDLVAEQLSTIEVTE